MLKRSQPDAAGEAVIAELQHGQLIARADRARGAGPGLSAPGREQVRAIAKVRVERQAAVLRGRPDGEHARRRAREQRPALALAAHRVARRRHHERPEPPRLAGCRADGRHLLTVGHRRIELQREVDHVGAVAGRPQDPLADVVAVPAPVRSRTRTGIRRAP